MIQRPIIIIMIIVILIIIIIMIIIIIIKMILKIIIIIMIIIIKIIIIIILIILLTNCGCQRPRDQISQDFSLVGCAQAGDLIHFFCVKFKKIALLYTRTSVSMHLLEIWHIYS